MSHHVNHHPDMQMLNDFSRGGLATGLSVAVSAHLELCGHCRHQVRELEAVAAREWLSPGAEPGFDATAQAAMIDNIVNKPQLTRVPATSAALQDCHFENHSVALPRVLARAAGSALVWKKVAGGINQARVGIDRQAQCDLMYMKPGSRAPLHTHRGTEVTLVLDGSFHDELGRYGPGDFLLRDGRHQHTPASDEGCLCFAVLDQPLTFSTGFARLLNPLQGLLFNR